MWNECWRTSEEWATESRVKYNIEKTEGMFISGTGRIRRTGNQTRFKKDTVEGRNQIFGSEHR